MLRKLLDLQLSLFDKGKPLHRLRPAVTALDTFLYEAPDVTKSGPHIRDAVDLKRWMVLVVIALIPCIIMAIWNTGVQSFVYSSKDFRVVDAYLIASSSFSGYFEFCFSEGRWIEIIKLGAMAFLPVMLISYIVGGIVEVFFAIIRRHEVAEGFLVTGMLYPLILPPTIPYWMVAVGVAAGVILCKELFGGTGMNIINPALCCRIILFFTFPAQMTGEIWIGTNPTVVSQSVREMNEQAENAPYDGYSQATPLAIYQTPDEVKRIHAEAIATNTLGSGVASYGTIQKWFDQWKGEKDLTLGSLKGNELKAFVTDSQEDGGLGLPPDSYEAAYRFAALRYGEGTNSDWNLVWGNRLGSMGSTSMVAILLGALFMLYVGVASWRKMVAVLIGAYVVGLLFQWGSHLGADGGAWNPARFSLPAYKMLILGGLAFGAVFMATDPVSSPAMKGAMWIYGLMIGALTVCIRAVNPAFPEGVMLAIVFGNVFAPLFDHYAAKRYRRPLRVRV